MSRTTRHLIHEGRYAAELEITYIDDDSPWSPLVRKEDVYKTDRVRLALRRGDLDAAAKEAIIYELTPVASDALD